MVYRIDEGRVRGITDMTPLMLNDSYRYIPQFRPIHHTMFRYGECLVPEAYLGFNFFGGGGGGGSKYFLKSWGICWREATRLLGGSGACSPEKII